MILQEVLLVSGGTFLCAWIFDEGDEGVTAKSRSEMAQPSGSPSDRRTGVVVRTALEDSNKPPAFSPRLKPRG